jgi:hypothetical protein
MACNIARILATVPLKVQQVERCIKMTPLETSLLTREDLWNMFQETAHQFKETDCRFKETDRFLKESRAEMDKVLKNLSKQLGDLGNRLGEFVEHMVAPAVVKLFQQQDIDVHACHREVEANREGESVEIALLVINDGTMVAVECKSKLKIEHVDEHLERMEKIKRVLPLYKNHRLLGAVASMVMNDNVKAYAQQQGFYVLCQNGESIELSNSPTFTPRAW